MSSILGTGSGSEGACEVVSVGDVVEVEAPAVLVLGVRHGTQPDLRRAARVVRRLHRRDKVTVAVQAVDRRKQRIVDQYADGDLSLTGLEQGLEWSTTWGFPFRPYGPLFSTTHSGVDLVGVGGETPLSSRSDSVSVPEGYADKLLTIQGDNPTVSALADRLAQTMAWEDHLIAERAIRAWNQEGFLVIVAARTRVEGGHGVSWQAAQRVSVPVHSAVLGWGDAPCEAGDRVWRGLFGE